MIELWSKTRYSNYVEAHKFPFSPDSSTCYMLFHCHDAPLWTESRRASLYTGGFNLPSNDRELQNHSRSSCKAPLSKRAAFTFRPSPIYRYACFNRVALWSFSCRTLTSFMFGRDDEFRIETDITQNLAPGTMIHLLLNAVPVQV